MVEDGTRGEAILAAVVGIIDVFVVGTTEFVD